MTDSLVTEYDLPKNLLHILLNQKSTQTYARCPSNCHNAHISLAIFGIIPLVVKVIVSKFDSINDILIVKCVLYMQLQ